MRKLSAFTKHLPEIDRVRLLSPAQLEVLLMTARGFGPADIAAKLQQSSSGIQSKKVRAFEWLSLSCNADATAFCLKHKLINSTISVVFFEGPPPVVIKYASKEAKAIGRKYNERDN